MKYIALALLLSACASYHHEPVKPPPAYAPTVGESFTDVETKGGKAERCLNFSTSKYCLHKSEVYFFANNQFQSKWTLPAVGLIYELNIESLSAGENAAKTAKVVPGRKSLNPNGIEWKRYSPLLISAIEANGYNLEDKAPAQLIKANFGLQDLGKLGARRYLSLTSYNAKKAGHEMWKIKIGSVGSGKDLMKVYPILVFGVYDFLSNPENKNIETSIKDNSFEYQAFKHHFKIK